MKNEKKEYIERGALIDSFDNCYYLYNSAVRETVRQALKNAPVADVAPVVHGERKFGGLDFDGVDEILKKHRAFVMATINGHGCHIGTYKKISLEADGDWIIDVDVEGLDVTGQGDVALVVHGEWISTTKHKWKTKDNGEVDEFAWDREFHNGPVCMICSFTPCVHCRPGWEDDEGCKEHFVCSVCGTHEEKKYPYCHCGAKMDGGQG